MGPFYALDGTKMQVRVADVAEPDEPLDVEVSEPSPEVPAAKPTDFKPRRVFIGRVQPSWGFGGKSQLTYLDHPGEDEVFLPDRIDHQQLESKLFVGKKPRPPPPPPVYAVEDAGSEEEEVEGRDDDGSMLALGGLEDAFSSPLTSLSDTELPSVADLEFDDGRYRASFAANLLTIDSGKSHSAHSLEDGDLAHAIALTLTTALSRAPTEPTTPISP